MKLEVTPTELKGGGTVYFTVKAWNFASDGLNIHFKVTDGEGAVVKEFNRFVPKGAGNYSVDAFSLKVYGVGKHTYTLTASIPGEEEKSTVTVGVEPTNGTKLEQVGFECDNPEFNWNGIEYKATVVCRAFIYNPTQKTIYLNSVSVKEWRTDNSDFTQSLSSSWVVEYPTVIKSSETISITFKNTAHTGLTTLEKDLFGAYVTMYLKYIISPQDGNDIIFTGTGLIHIRQDNSDVAIDVGTNLVLIGGEVKVIVISVKLIRMGEMIKGLSELAPVIADFIRRAYGWR
ncbi:hypothetical protein [Thermococcus henrietii]|uniref:hypothetical protein n=1 Tax=Thermococcus henrietii TaxID=2016361 RepID=UPI0011AB6F59|nr:hypothetical protein [Thermococcus henrietii]